MWLIAINYWNAVINHNLKKKVIWQPDSVSVGAVDFDQLKSTVALISQHNWRKQKQIVTH